MGLNFEDEVRAYLHHQAEQTPVLHELEQGTLSYADVELPTLVGLLALQNAAQTAVLIKIAQEIDTLRAAIDGR